MAEDPNKKKTGWIVYITLFFVMIIAHAIFKEIGRDIGRTTAKSLVESYQSGANEVYEYDETINTTIKNIAETMNKQCPMKLDKYTTALGVFPCLFASGRKVIYRYQLDIDQLMKDTNTDLTTLKNVMYQTIITEYSTNPSCNLFKIHNVELEYQYIDLDGNYLFKFVINENNVPNNRKEKGGKSIIIG